MQPRKFASLRHCFGGAVVWFMVLMAKLVFPAPVITQREPGERMSLSGTKRTFSDHGFRVRSPPQSRHWGGMSVERLLTAAFQTRFRGPLNAHT